MIFSTRSNHKVRGHLYPGHVIHLTLTAFHKNMEGTSRVLSTTSASTPTVASVHLTLPLSCQVCLGKVKDPVICANQHVFCSSCMSKWLDVSKSKMCPTCRVPVSDKQPCKRIIGSMEVSSTINDKSIREQMRKTRFEILFQEYEKEICSLELQLEESQTENRHIKEINADLKTRLDSAESKFLTAVKAGKHDHQNGETHDIGTILKLSTRLQDMINYNNDLKEENNALKKQLQDVMRKNEDMKEEMEKMSYANNYNSSPKKFSRYTMAALETKVDTYEREISRLKRALERSDDYIEELKRHQQSHSRNLFEDIPPRLTEHGLCNGTYESPFPAQSKSPQDIESPLMSVQNSRIDELATVALATRGSRYPDFSVPASHGADMTLQSQLQRSYNVTSSESEKEPKNEAPTPRSIFEDPSKFPACAKLIELTKVRRDFAEQQPGEILPLDATGGLLDQVSNHSDSPSHQADVEESTMVKTSPRNLARPIENIQNRPLMTPGKTTTDSYCRGSSPSPSCSAFTDVSYSKQGDVGCMSADSQTDLHDNQRFSQSPARTSPTAQSYPSSVILSGDSFGPKRIKVEKTE